MKDSFGARSTLAVGNSKFEIFRLDAVKDGHAKKLPYSLKILLENLLRHLYGKLGWDCMSDLDLLSRSQGST